MQLGRIKPPTILSIALLVCTLLIGVVIGTVLNTGVKAQKQTSPIAPDATPLTIPQAVPISTEFTKLAKRLQTSVVYIQSDYLAKAGKKGKKGDEDDEDEGAPNSKDPSDIFKHFFGKEEPRSFRTEGSGTGFVVDRNGYIITNNHVIDKADRIKVVLNGEPDEFRAHVVGVDAETDVAVLKIDAGKPLVPVQMGNSDGVEVGDWVVAIGSPFGLQATVTAGIVSATGRDLGSGQFQHFLQTDAAINPGNSGGPLLNVRGEVIGINTMIATHSGSYEGIGFALPSNMAVKVYNDVIRSGRVIRGSIGIRWPKAGNTEDTLRGLGLDHGVIVEFVEPSGPAGKAGLKADDIIVAMNDHSVKDGDELVNKVADLPIGSVASFTVDRNGKQMDFKIGVEDRQVVWKDATQLADARPSVPEPPRPAVPTEVKFGITITNLREKERQDLGIDDKAGVRVVSVDPGSFADDIGLQENDTIIAVNRQPVNAPADILRLQKSLKPGAPVAVHVIRSIDTGGRRTPPSRLYLSGRLPDE